MEANQIELVRKSWAIIRPNLREVGELFYEELFVAAPHLRKMFPFDITIQVLKLMAMIGELVTNLDNLDFIKDDIRQLGLRHHEYGTTPGHYNLVGEVLIAALRKNSGRDWSEEIEEAWKAAYQVLADAMMDSR